MANEPLESIKFPGIADKFTVPAVDNTLTVQGAVADAKAVGDALNNLDVDATLTRQGKPADAKKVGDEISDLKADLAELEPGLSDDAKVALLACFEHVAWVDEHGQDYYDDLESALYDSPERITAVFTQGDDVFFTDDSLDDLKSNLVVTHKVGSEKTILTPSQYTITGTLAVGTNTLTVIYNNLTATFTVNAIANIAGALSNMLKPSASAAGTYVYSNGTYKVTCSTQSAVDNWWTWLADTRTNHWSDIEGKTVCYRLKLRRLTANDEDAFINWYSAMFSASELTSMNNDTRNFVTLNNRLVPTSEFVKYQAVVVADASNYTGNVTPDANTMLGHLMHVRSLDTIEFAEIKMGVM